MLRVLALCGVAALGGMVAMTGGQFGPVDLTEVPPTFLAFAAVTGLVMLGLRSI